MSVKIITDSASDVLTRYHPAVSVLPMTITFGDQQYRDKEELSHQRFYELLITDGYAKWFDTVLFAILHDSAKLDIFREHFENNR